MTQLASIDELRNRKEATFSAPAAELLPYFSRLSEVGSDEIIRELSTLTWLVAGGWLLSAVAALCGVVHLVAGDREPVLRFVVAMVAGTVYGIVKIVRSRVRFVDKRSGQDVTLTVPFSIGFGVGVLGFGIEALLSLAPIPSVIPAALLFALLFAIWLRRRPPERKLLDRIPHLGFSLAMLRLARPDAPSSIAWRGDSYDAQTTLQNGARLVCRTDIGPHGQWFELVIDHAQPLPWRYAQERLVVDFVNLEHSSMPNGPRVRATNSAPGATARHLVDALNIAANACRA